MKSSFFIIFGTIYCLIFGEYFVTFFAPGVILPRYVTAAPYGVRMNVPNAQYWQTTPEVHVQVRINSQGIRADKEFSYEKPKDKCRIVLFGDSFFMGYEVDLQDSFAELLEHTMNSEGYPCEVINLAVSGFGTAEMLITLENKGLAFHPDLVVFQWHSTDTTDNIRSGLFRLISDHQLTRLNSTYLPGVKISDWLTQFTVYRWMIENSQLYSATRESLSTKIQGILLFLNQFKMPVQRQVKEEKKEKVHNNNYPMKLSIALLQEANQLSQKYQARFCVLEIPNNPSPGKPIIRGHLAEFPSIVRKELMMFSPLEVFQQAAYSGTKIYYEKGHFHLTPKGNRLLTEYFVSQLKTHHLLDLFKSSPH